MDVPRVESRGGPSPAEPPPASATLDPDRSRSTGPLLETPAHASTWPGKPFALVRGLLTRLVPGRNPETRARQDSEFEAAARQAYQSASEFKAGAPMAEPSPALPAPQTGVPTRALEAAMRPTAPITAPTTIATPAPTAPSVAPDSDADAVAAATARTSAWVAPPHRNAEQAVSSLGAPEEGSAAPRRRRQPGDTAPEFLLQTPTSVTHAADDFFDGITRRIERDR